jgi:hypothetical protein
VNITARYHTRVVVIRMLLAVFYETAATQVLLSTPRLNIRSNRSQ